MDVEVPIPGSAGEVIELLAGSPREVESRGCGALCLPVVIGGGAGSDAVVVHGQLKGKRDIVDGKNGNIVVVVLFKVSAALAGHDARGASGRPADGGVGETEGGVSGNILRSLDDNRTYILVSDFDSQVGECIVEGDAVTAPVLGCSADGNHSTFGNIVLYNDLCGGKRGGDRFVYGIECGILVIGIEYIELAGPIGDSAVKVGGAAGVGGHSEADRRGRVQVSENADLVSLCPGDGSCIGILDKRLCLTG